jgi:hypothetical protein
MVARLAQGTHSGGCRLRNDSTMCSSGSGNTRGTVRPPRHEAVIYFIIQSVMCSLPAIALVMLSAPSLADTAAVRTDTGLVQGVLDDVIVYREPLAGKCGHGHESTPRPRTARHSFTTSPPNTKSGNPNGRGLQNWPEFSPRNERVMYIGPTFEAGTMPDLAAHFLMDTYMNAKRAQ